MGKTKRRVEYASIYRQMRCRPALKGVAASIAQFKELDITAPSRWSNIVNPWDDLPVSGVKEVPNVKWSSVKVWHRTLGVQQVTVGELSEFCQEMRKSGATSFELDLGDVHATLALYPVPHIDKVVPSNTPYGIWGLESLLLKPRSRFSTESWERHKKLAREQLLDSIAAKPSVWRALAFDVKEGQIESATLCSKDTSERVVLSREDLIQCGFGSVASRGTVSWKFWKDSCSDLIGEQCIVEVSRVVVCR